MNIHESVFGPELSRPQEDAPPTPQPPPGPMQEPTERWSEIQFLGKSDVMQDLQRRLDMAASCDAPVILVGEGGTGKSLAARYIHGHSARASHEARIVNCAALPDWLLESELFGHIAGALPGTTQDKTGAFELAYQGTLIIESVDAMSAELQQKLARTIQHHEIWRVGATEATPIHVRVIMTLTHDVAPGPALLTPTSGPLDQIGAFTIRLPALREYRQDIPRLAEAFLQRFQSRWSARPATLAWETIACLLGNDWPGNVRQLREAVELAAAQVHGERLLATDLPANLRTTRLPGPLPLDTSGKLDAKLAEKREALVGALERAHGNRTIAAKLLGVSRVTLWKRMRQLQVD
jgi:two-component system response regulator HydG